MTDQEWIEEALEHINQFRGFHQADELEWSDECYKAAKAQAEKCSEKGELLSGNLSGKSGLYGQSLYAAPDGQEVDLSEVCKEWYQKSEEYDFFRPAAVSGCEDFTQLIWKGTQQVGIAISDDKKYCVANFFPEGNVDGAFTTNVLLPVFEVDEDTKNLGMLFSSYPPNQLVVRKVNEDSWAESVDIGEGDRFYSINEIPVTDMSTDEFKKIMQERPLRLCLFMGVDTSEEQEDEEEEEEANDKEANEQEANSQTSRRVSADRGKSELVAGKDVDKIGMILSLPPKALEVRKVTPGGWADSQGIEPGDTFMEVNGVRVSELTPEQFTKAMQERPIRFKLASEEEIKAAVNIQRHARGSMVRKAAKTPEWRKDRVREAQKELKADKAESPSWELTQAREELIQAVFLACDADGDERLKKTELLRFVRHIDFPGTDEEWDKEYNDLCTEYKWPQAIGLSYEDFRDLVEDENGNPYYCGNERLDGMLEALERTDAAIKIQKVQKGRAARKKVAEQQLDTKKLQEKAATQGLINNNAVEESPSSSPTDKKGGGPSEKDKAEAATKIQSAERGRKARLDAKKRKDDAGTAKTTKVAKNPKEEKAEPKSQPSKNNLNSQPPKAELKSQAPQGKLKSPVGNGNLKAAEASFSKEEMKKREDAAKKIQSIERGRKARQKVGKMKEDPKKTQNRAARQAAKNKEELERLEKMLGESAAKKHVAAKKMKEEVELGVSRAKGRRDIDKQQEDAARKIQAAERGRMQRKDMLKRKQAFFKLDVDEDGFLNEQEMKEFAICLGYDGSDSAWRQEYDAMCYQYRWNPRVGLSERDFIWLTTNPAEQYWFDARLLDQGWEVAACLPSEGLGDTLYPSDQSRGIAAPSGVEIASRMQKDLQRSGIEVPIVAEVTGVDWDRLLNNEALKARVEENISKILNRRLQSINTVDLKVSLSAASS